MKSKGFTLIELLIVVAIIGILAAIAIPNFLEAQTRAKVARSVSELRTIGIALETYAVDQNAYPQSNIFALAITPPGQPWPITLERLTTPVAYLSNVTLEDPFPTKFRYYGSGWTSEAPVGASELAAAQVYNYTARNTNGMSQHGDPEFAKWWILESVGPDMHYHNLSGHINTLPDDNVGLYSCFIALYDATNGTVSRGSIWRVGGSPVEPGRAFFRAAAIGSQ